MKAYLLHTHNLGGGMWFAVSRLYLYVQLHYTCLIPKCNDLRTFRLIPNRKFIDTQINHPVRLQTASPSTNAHWRNVCHSVSKTIVSHRKKESHSAPTKCLREMFPDYLSQINFDNQTPFTLHEFFLYWPGQVLQHSPSSKIGSSQSSPGHSSLVQVTSALLQEQVTQSLVFQLVSWSYVSPDGSTTQGWRCSVNGNSIQEKCFYK